MLKKLSRVQKELTALKAAPPPDAKSTKPEKRIQWIDLLESIAIFMVVLYHGSSYSWNIIDPNATAQNYFYYLFNTLLSSSVPLFFFANGYLLFKKNFDLKRHLRKIIKISFLTVFWGALTLIILMLIYNQYLPLKDFIQAIWQRKMNWTNHLWYLGVLISIYILFPLLKTVYDTNKKVFLYFTIIASILIIGNNTLNQIHYVYQISIKGQLTGLKETNFFNIYTPFLMYNSYSLVYFCLGGVMLQYQDKINKIAKNKRNLIALLGISVSSLLLFGIGILYSGPTRPEAKAYDVVYPCFGSIFTLIITIGIYLLCLNYKSNNRIITLISHNTLGIYLVHMILIHCSTQIRRDVPFIHTMIGSIFYTLLIVIASLGISLLIKKIPIVKRFLL